MKAIHLIQFVHSLFRQQIPSARSPWIIFLVILMYLPGFLSGQSIIYYPPASAPGATGCSGTNDLITVTFTLSADSRIDMLVLDQNSALLADLTDSILFATQSPYIYEICVPANGCSKLVLTPLSLGFNGTYLVEFNGTEVATGGSFNTLTIVSNIGDTGCSNLPDCDAYLSMFGKAVPGSPSACEGVPLRSPCPTLTWRYCALLSNFGQNPIQAGSQVTFQLDPDMTYLDIGTNPCGMNFLSYNAGSNEVFFETTTDILSLNSCEICIDVQVGPVADVSPPWTTVANLAAQCTGNSDNATASIDEYIQCSCDPNDMQVSPAGCGSQGSIPNERLTYQIRFQNLGLGPAFDIVVSDELDEDLDISSLQLIATSHPLKSFAVTSSNELVITYEEINLPAAEADEAGSNGYVIFSIAPKAGLADGTTIDNSAAIYFDNNPPVITNVVTNTIYNGFMPPVADIVPDLTNSSPGCVNLSAIVSGGVSPFSYEWNTGATTSSIEVCPDEVAFYRVRITDANGCIATSTEEVNACSEEIYCGQNEDKVLVCHNPSGNPADRFTICISPNAVEKHLAHGDFIGSCDQTECILPPSSALITGATSGAVRPFTEPTVIEENKSNLSAYPNPFSDLIKVEFYLPAPEEVSLDVLNINGQVVRRLKSGEQPQGFHYLTWEGRDEKAQLLPDGLYFLRMKTGKEILEQRVLFIR